MSTVIGLVKEEQQLSHLTASLEAVGCALDKIKIVTRPDEVRQMLDKWALSECHMFDCIAGGVLAGLAVFVPFGLLSALFGCAVVGLGCGPLAFIPVVVSLVIAGVLIGAGGGYLYGIRRLNRTERIYTDGVDEGHKLIIVSADTKENAARTATLLQQEQATAIKILGEQA